MEFSRNILLLLLLSSLACGQPQVDYFDVQPNPVYLDSVAEFTVEASCEDGIGSIYLRESGGVTRECECGGSKKCSSSACRCVNGPCFKKDFDSAGSYEFCARADNSQEVCINLDVITLPKCEEIFMGYSTSEVQIATKIKTRRIRKGIHGFDGYPLDCCPYCEEILINNSDCRMLGGSLALDYTLVYYNHSNNETYRDFRFPKNIQNITPNPLVLCSAVINENQTVLGIVDVVEFHLLDSVYNEERMKHWLIGTGKKLIGEPWDAIKIEALKEAAKGFVDISTGAGKRVGLVSFNQDASIDSHLTSDGGTLHGIIDSYVPYGATNMGAAIRRGVEVLGAGGGAMVFMSDGRNTVLTDPIAAADDAKAAGVVIHTIALGNDADKATLNEIAGITGGGSYEVTCDSSLSSIYEGLAENLQDAVLVSDISGSMMESQHLACYEQTPGYFLADQMFSNETETKEYVIVDSGSYSSAVNELMAGECYHKQHESTECHFDCPEFDERCDPSCLCYGAPLGCLYCIPEVCECCHTCNQVYDYKDCFYDKYEIIYGRPYVDYLYCWKTPLKDTGWCHQRMDLPGSVVNYPWYAISAEKDKESPRELDKISPEYIDDLHIWNRMQDINEKPARSFIRERTLVPEVYCHHDYDEKLFRTVWAKIFTVTPYLNDERNDMGWTRTGKGAIYAGSGFRREPSCWWECCRRCAPFCCCDCTCEPIPVYGPGPASAPLSIDPYIPPVTPGTGTGPMIGVIWPPCCMNATFGIGVVEGVTNTMEFTIPNIEIDYTSSPIITPSPDNKQVTVTNGALTIISTGNFPFEVSSADFAADSNAGRYTMTIVYTPIGDEEHDPFRHQFVVEKDIVFNYTLLEGAENFTVDLNEDFSTALDDFICECQPNETTCLYNNLVHISTTESIRDTLGTYVAIDMKNIEALREAAHGFVDIAITRDVRVGLVALSQNYGSCPQGICSSHEVTSDDLSLDNQINTYRSRYGTCTSCGIRKAAELLRDTEITGEKHIIVMSDGVPNCCESKNGDVCVEGIENLNAAEDQGQIEARYQAMLAYNEGIRVHTIALGDDSDRPFIEGLANIGGGNYYNVTCDCDLECIYKKLARTVVGEGDGVVLTSDVSASMSNRLSLDCPGEGVPVTHKNILRDMNLSITGVIDNEAYEFTTHKGILNITATPDIISGFSLNVGGENLDYTSLLYPTVHETYKKEYAHGKWIEGRRYVVGVLYRYGYLPSSETYTLEDSYGYEGRPPSVVNFEFLYPEQGRKICPPECSCPSYDPTDVTCVDYSTDPPVYYRRDDCICPELSQSRKRDITSSRTYHEEEHYYYDFAEFYTLETEGGWNAMSVMDEQTKERPHPPVGGLSGNVIRNTNMTQMPTHYIYIANSNDDTVSKVRTVDCVEECRYNVEENPSRTAVSLSRDIWVGNMDADTISRLEATSCNTIEHIKVGEGPRAIVVDEDNNLWVGNADDNTLWKFNGYTGECLVGDPAINPSCPPTSSPIPVEGSPYGGVADCRGHIWVICVPGGVLYEIDVHTDSEVARYPIPKPPNVGPTGGWVHGITLDSNGDIWLGGSESGYVYKVSGSTGDILCQEDVGDFTKGIAVDPEDNVWVADYTRDEVIKVNGLNCGVINRYPVGDGPVGVAVDFDGSVWTVNYDGNSATKLNISSGNIVCTADVGEGPYTFSDMTGFNLWGICKNRELDPTMATVKSIGSYILNFTALPFPKSLSKEDFENASVTVFIHFRDNITSQTFPLFPSREELTPPLNRQFIVNVSMRDATKILIERVTPNRYNINPGTELEIHIRLMNAITGEAVPSKDIHMMAEAYRFSQIITTDEGGRAIFPLDIGEYGTKVNFEYLGSDMYIPTKTSDYYDVVSLSKVWWLLSPEVLLLIMALITLAVSYKWFGDRKINIDELMKELKGEK